LAQVEGVFAGSLPGERSASLLAKIAAVIGDAARWERVGGTHWVSAIVADPEATSQHWRAVVAAANSCADAASSINACLGLATEVPTRDSTHHALLLAARLAKVGNIPAAWVNIQALEAAAVLATRAKACAEQLMAAEEELFARFDEEILADVDDNLRIRYKADYRSKWRWFKANYRRDHRMLRGRLRAPTPLSVEEAIGAIERALVINSLRQQWESLSQQAAASLGYHFNGLKTDWDAVAAQIETAMQVFREHPTLQQRFHEILSDIGEAERLNGLRSCVAERLDLLQSCVAANSALVTAPFTAIAEDAARYADAVATVAGVVRDLALAGGGTPDIHELSRILRVSAEVHTLEATAARESVVWARAIGVFFDMWATDFGTLEPTVAWTRELLSSLPMPLSEDIIDIVTAAPDREVWREYGRLLADAASEFVAIQQSLGDRYLEQGMPWHSWSSADFRAVRAWCADLASHADDAHAWLEYCAAATALNRALYEGATKAVRLVTERASEVPDIVMRHVYLLWLEHAYEIDANLRVAPSSMEALADRFRDLDKKLPESARERVKASCRKGISGIRDAGGYGEVGILMHQLSLRRRQMPVRRLVVSIPNLLPKIKPCFMMSPLAVSQYLPRGGSEAVTMHFDAVIFDEASQAFPEDAVPAIARGKQCIVVGDREQLPPSSFFRSNDDDDDDDDDDEKYDEENDGASVNRLRGVESILDVLIGLRGSGVDEVYLQVHYRSQHDSLIRYSNHYFYEDRLLTFPAATVMRPGLGVRSIHVPEGRFEAGGSRTNRIEAARVIDTIFALME
jgi:hypothetical protein